MTTTPNLETIHAAYYYLLGRVLAIRQEQVDVAETPYNMIKFNPLGAASADFVNPNLDVAYWEAWIAVDDNHPVILTIPEIRGRYYTVQVMDSWAEVIANVNERTYPERPFGPVVFVKQGTNPPVPQEAVRIELPAGKGKVLARVELSDTPDAAVALQHRFALAVPPGIVVEPAPAIPSFASPHLPDVWIFDQARQILASCPDAMPDAPRLQAMVDEVVAYAETGEQATSHLQRIIDDQLKGYLLRMIAARPARGGWAIMSSGGRYGNDYELRTLCNYGGIWANVPQEVVYYTARTDASGDRLSGSCHYTVRFEADAQASSACTAFWSITMLRLPDYRAVPNAIDRFTINDVTGAQPDPDGSLTLHIAPELPAGVAQANWLPSPRDTETILTFRLYVPTESALDERWYVPPLVRVP